ncbi:MAG: hypothetical protein Q7U74_13345, partial [Saprospiraceae bacterium]|nr:hypothetical protein [Saprospiraceae bacterium]
MNIIRNHSKHVYLAKLTSSVGRVCLIFVFALILMGCSAVVQAEPLAATTPAQDSAVKFAGLNGALKPEEAVTCTTTTVTQTLCSVTGTIKEADAPAAAAYKDSLNTYEALAPAPCTQVLTGTLADVTLAPGVYCFDSAAT